MIKRRMFLSVIVLGFLLCLFAGACAPTPTTAPTPSEPVKIGFLAPLTGTAQTDSIEMVKGFKLAVTEFNDAGGILGGRQVEMVVRDEGWGEATTLVTKKLILSDKVSAIVGCYWTDTALIVTEICQEHGIPYMDSWGMGASATQVGYPGMLKVTSRIDGTHKPFCRWLEEQGVTKAVIGGCQSMYHDQCYQSFSDMWNRPGSPVELMPQVTWPIEQVDVSMETTQAVGSGADYIYFTVIGVPQATHWFKLLHDLGYEGIFSLPCVNLGYPHVVASGELIEGCVDPMPYSPDPNVPENLAFIEKWEAAYVEPPNCFNYLCYLGAHLMIAGMDAAGTDTDTMAIIEAIRGMDYTLTTGDKMVFREDGQLMWDTITIAQVIDQQIKVVDYVKAEPGDQGEAFNHF